MGCGIVGQEMSVCICSMVYEKGHGIRHLVDSLILSVEFTNWALYVVDVCFMCMQSNVPVY